MNTTTQPIIRWAAAGVRAPRLRTLCEFAEQEVVLPTGPFAGRRFKLDRHPVARLLFNELDSGRWRRAFITGPNMDGKSLMGFVVPTMWLLFERQETVILGVPTLEMVADKWNVDLKPVIAASRYADLLPTTGAGSNDGDSVLFSFRHGPRLRFMTGGGGDKSRSGFSSPNLVVTETDGFDEVGSKSREGSKFDQLVRRTLADAEQSRVWAECTVSTESGRTWQEYQAGTQSRIALPCPHCGAYVTPEREHFRGWQDAADALAAEANAFVACPACGAAWTDEQRLEANRRGVLVHRGQEVSPDGTVTGEPPRTDTLGFRWTVVNSAISPRRLAMVGAAEWKAQRAADEELAERELRQSQWALPARPSKAAVSQFDALAIMGRTLKDYPRGVCPDDTAVVTVACDVNKYLLHWVAVAWRPAATPHVVDYGREEVASNDFGEDPAIRNALRKWRDEVVNQGWQHKGARLLPLVRFVDAGNWRNTVLAFVAESGQGWFGTKGYGLGQRRAGESRRETGSVVVGAGDHYALVKLPDGRQYVEVNADHWKGFWHARLRAPLDQPGAATLFPHSDHGGHLPFAKHQIAEKQVEEWSPAHGTVTVWQSVSKSNHWFDAMALACVAGHAAGMRGAEDPVLAATPQPAPPPRPETTISYSDWINRHKRW